MYEYLAPPAVKERMQHPTPQRQQLLEAVLGGRGRRRAAGQAGQAGEQPQPELG